MTNLNTIKIPEGTMKAKIAFLMDNYPNMSRPEMAELLDKSVATIYSYVSDIKKSREKSVAKSKPKSKSKSKDVPQETTPKVEDEPKEEPKEVMQLEVPKIVEEEFVLETTIVEENHKLPATLEFSLTGVSGELLQRVLYNLLGNSLDANSEYSFVLTLQKTK